LVRYVSEILYIDVIEFKLYSINNGVQSLGVPIIAVGTPKILLGVLNGLHYMYKKLVPTYLDEYKLIEIKPIIYIIYYLIIYISQILLTHSFIATS